MELLIAVAIVGILAAIAMPAYESQLRRSARAEAQSFLTDAATRQQQYLIDRRSYATSIGALNLATPGDLTSKYTFTVVVADGPPPTYTFTATAIGQQALDTCPTITLNNAGVKTPDKCW